MGHGSMLEAVLDRAHSSPGRGVLVPGKNVVLQAGPSCPGLHGQLLPGYAGAVGFFYLWFVGRWPVGAWGRVGVGPWTPVPLTLHGADRLRDCDLRTQLKTIH